MSASTASSSNSFPQSSIPTPPFSPLHQLPHDQDHNDNPLKSTIDLLDSLVGFYHHERMWVYRTRAALHEASNRGDSDTTDTDSLPSPESDDCDKSPSALPTQSSSPWLRRKRGFKLRLDRLPQSALTSTGASSTSQGEGLPRRERILEMFEKMMEARMESCQRVNRLVRSANRADIHRR